MHATTFLFLRKLLKEQVKGLRNEVYRQIQEHKKAGLRQENDEKLLQSLETWLHEEGKEA